MTSHNDMTPKDSPDFAVLLSRFSSTLTTEGLPPEALAAAKANVFDTLACAAAGSSAPAVAQVRELATEWGGAPQAGVLVFGDRIPAHHAAWVNATMAHARDYDDTHDAAVLHAGVSVVPAALAAAELAGGVSGADFLAAVAAGLETVCRIGVATRIGIIESGWMYTSLFGYFGATVAAARVLRLDEAATVNALGIAYSQVAGNHQVTRDAALTKRIQPGYAAMSALMSVQLSRRGVRGVQATFEGEDGFLRVYLHDKVDRAALREGLGERFEFTQLSYKPYPCCRFDHVVIDAALALRAQTGRSAEAIRRVRIGLNHQAYEAVCTPLEMRKAPRTMVQAQFSVPYTFAAAWIDGSVRLEHFGDASLRRPDLLALASRVEGYVDAEIERDAGRSISPARVEIEMINGAVFRTKLDVPLGAPSRPMSKLDFDAKAADCFAAAAREMPADSHRALRTIVDDLEEYPDAGALVAAMKASN
jgi:2-methylcitrate dehydratase PrpD